MYESILKFARYLLTVGGNYQIKIKNIHLQVSSLALKELTIMFS